MGHARYLCLLLYSWLCLYANVLPLDCAGLSAVCDCCTVYMSARNYQSVDIVACGISGHVLLYTRSALVARVYTETYKALAFQE